MRAPEALQGLAALCVGLSCGRAQLGVQEHTASSVVPVQVSVTRPVVEREARRLGIPFPLALRRLLNEAALEHVAASRGYADSRVVRRGLDRASVHVFLRTAIESAVIEDDISTDDVEKYYVEHQHRFNHAERRASAHLLARVEPGASAHEWESQRRYVARLLPRLQQASEPVQELFALARGQADKDVVAEVVSPLPADSEQARPYANALFEATGPGIIPHPIRTEHGWHAIVVTHIEGAKAKSLEEATEEIRSQLVSDRRSRELAGHVRSAGNRWPVAITDGIHEVLAAIDVDDGRP